MSGIAEIRQRLAVADCTTLGCVCTEHHAVADELIDLVRRMRDCLHEFAVCRPVLDDERLRYVEIQVGREDLELAKALVKEAE